MNFATAQFSIFFAIVFFLYWHLRKKHQNLLLLGASMAFYSFWDWRFLSLIVISIVSNYYGGQWIAEATTKTKRNIWLILCIAINISLLAYFKYANFFIESTLALAAEFNWHVSEVTLNITLPVGISFYIFQSLSYSLDIYRGKLTPQHGLLDFATFVAFFPQLVAGPIVRAKEFLFQLEAERIFKFQQLENGITRFLTGLFKKVVIADSLAVYLVDPVFSNPDAYSSGTLWLAMFGYAIQIYADFSGYSNMAIGCALMLGFKIPENFNYPYLATNFSSFWQRWHMTMSRFFRDYVYIPMGGNRRSSSRNMINLATTTLVSGLWHGAAWTFVCWGGLHGVYIVASHIISDFSKKARFQSFLHLLPAWFFTQIFVCFAWVLFRSQDLPSAQRYLTNLFISDNSGPLSIEVSWYIALCFIAVVIDHLYGFLKEKNYMVSSSIQKYFKPAFIAALVIIIFNGRPEQASPFIYFQF